MISIVKDRLDYAESMAEENQDMQYISSMDEMYQRYLKETEK